MRKCRREKDACEVYVKFALFLLLRDSYTIVAVYVKEATDTYISSPYVVFNLILLYYSYDCMLEAAVYDIIHLPSL